MKTKLDVIIRARVIRSLFFFLLISLCSFFLVLFSHIPHVEKSIEMSDDLPTRVDLKIKDPYLKRNLFTLHDLSKTEYTLNLPNNKNDLDFLWITETYDSLYNSGSNFTTIFSEMDGGDSQTFGDMVVVKPYFSQIHFYTRNVMAENTQMIRNFFITEIILFLLMLFGKEMYKLFSDVFADKIYSHRRIFGIETAKKQFAFYIVISLLTTVLLYCINIVPENTVTSNNYIQKRGNLFALHDISCANNHLQVHVASDADKNVRWQSEEIVEFIPNNFEPASYKRGPNSITFTNVAVGQSLDVRFYTHNLQSANYQEIRLFIITTLLLFFLERSFYYFRKWMRNRAFEKIKGKE